MSDQKGQSNRLAHLSFCTSLWFATLAFDLVFPHREQSSQASLIPPLLIVVLDSRLLSMAEQANKTLCRLANMCRDIATRQYRSYRVSLTRVFIMPTRQVRENFFGSLLPPSIYMKTPEMSAFSYAYISPPSHHNRFPSTSTPLLHSTLHNPS